MSIIWDKYTNTVFKKVLFCNGVFSFLVYFDF